MRSKRNILILLLSCLFVFSCTDKDDDVKKNKNKDKDKDVISNPTNDFVWKALNSWYYWQKDVPNLSDNAFPNTAAYNSFIDSKETEEFFYSLLYKYQEVDRFSWIVSDLGNLLKQFSGISKSTGMDLSLTRVGKEGVIAAVNYVIPNSPADAAGMKRGFVLIGVNGKELNLNNYRDLFSDNFTVTYVKALKINSDNSLGIVGDKMQANIHSEVLKENPVAFDTVYTEGSKKIGYLVYNGFKSNYNDELNDKFSHFKAQGVTELILDLRYNGGGAVSTAVALGQMITGGFTGEPYVHLDFNEKHSNEDYTYSLKKDMNIYDFRNGENQRVGTASINSLNLKKVYILTSGGTASASELTITGLKPYIDVVTIGGETYGKFVGSITLVDDPQRDYILTQNFSKKDTWAMQPIVFAYYNASRDAHPQKGVIPNFPIGEINYYLGMGAFGDIDADPALKKAYDLITGNAERRSYQPSFKINTEFIGTSSTLRPFGTELYIEP